jgi:alkanesulfonate monooxygenase SsuD/methylene tetrahydromethanopterin reductase-like flavin-dependent oxidoreductase (luciferase family)
MEYGITIPRTEIAEQPDPLKYLTHFAESAAQMGCAYCVTGDRLESGLDAFNVLTAIAAVSGHMRLVTSVLVLPPRGILVSAKQFAALDVLSGGRVIAGVGTGSMFRDYEVVGMNPDDMWPRFEEGVKAMRAYLTPDAQPFKGKFYDTTGVELEPKPVQKPSLPIWIGSWGSNVGLRRVARLADGWLSSAGPGHQSPEQFAADIKRLNAFLIEEGKDLGFMRWPIFNAADSAVTIGAVLLVVSLVREDRALRRAGAAAVDGAEAPASPSPRAVVPDDSLERGGA